MWLIASLLTVAATAADPATGVYVCEVLADPPPGPAGDANGDGLRETFADEFVEIVNGGIEAVALSGWRLGDDDDAPDSWFVFPELTLQPGQRTVLFGGGSPRGIPSPAFTDDGRIGDGLANGGDGIVLITAQGDTADLVVGSGWGDDRSSVRAGPGAPLLPHPAAFGRFSPGRAVPAPPESIPRAEPVRIVEILADPPPGDDGDAGGDGERHAYADEFIEIWNAGPDPVDIAGWRLGDDDGKGDGRFRFPAGTELAPGARAVLFGGGRPSAAAGGVFVDDGRIGNGLSNAGDSVLLLDADGDTVDVVAGHGWPSDRSIVRFPEGCGPPRCAWLPHDDPRVSARRFSPGAPAAEDGD